MIIILFMTINKPSEAVLCRLWSAQKMSFVAPASSAFCINSFTHLIGKRRFPSTDHSRNNLLLALITLGEGWHNNHHYYPGSERQGFYWWEIDISHYILTVLSWFGIVWNLRVPPARVYAAAGKF